MDVKTFKRNIKSNVKNLSGKAAKSIKAEAERRAEIRRAEQRAYRKEALVQAEKRGRERARGVKGAGAVWTPPTFMGEPKKPVPRPKPKTKHRKKRKTQARKPRVIVY